MERVPLSAPLLTGERDITLPLADVELPGDGRHTLEPLGGGVGLLSAAGLPLLPLPTVPDGGARQRLGGGGVARRRGGGPGARGGGAPGRRAHRWNSRPRQKPIARFS